MNNFHYERLNLKGCLLFPVVEYELRHEGPLKSRSLPPFFDTGTGLLSSSIACPDDPASLTLIPSISPQRMPAAPTVPPRVMSRSDISSLGALRRALQKLKADVNAAQPNPLQLVVCIFPFTSPGLYGESSALHFLVSF